MTPVNPELILDNKSYICKDEDGYEIFRGFTLNHVIKYGQRLKWSFTSIYELTDDIYVKGNKLYRRITL